MRTSSILLLIILPIVGGSVGTVLAQTRSGHELIAQDRDAGSIPPPSPSRSLYPQQTPIMSDRAALSNGSTYTNLTWSNANRDQTSTARDVQGVGDTDGLSWKIEAPVGFNKASVNINLAEASAFNAIRWTPEKGGVGLYAYLNAGCESGSCVDAGIVARTGSNLFVPCINVYEGPKNRHLWGEPGVTLVTGQKLPTSTSAAINPTHLIQLVLESTDNGFTFKIIDFSDGNRTIWDTGEVRAAGFTSSPSQVTLSRIVSLAWGNYSMESIYNGGTALKNLHMKDASLYNTKTGWYGPWGSDLTKIRRLYPDRRIASWFLDRKVASVTFVAPDEEIVSMGRVE